MKPHMAIALTYQTNSQSENPLVRIIMVLNEVIDKLKESKQSIKNNANLCWEIRKDRKVFESQIKYIIKDFDAFPEKDRVRFELALFQALNEIEQIAPEVIANLRERNVPVFSWFLIREIKRTTKVFERSQRKMASKLYPDPTDKILNDPLLAKKITDAWGDLADDEY
jgi:hypothetical protein